MDVVVRVMGFEPATLCLGELFDTGTAVGRLLLNLLATVHIDTKQARSVVAIRPKPAFRPCSR